MAKKHRGRRRRGKKRRAPVAAARSAPPREERKAEAKAEPSMEAVALAEQYPYVYGDLKRIAILASTMFAIIIVLSFLIK
ncbi:MAG TPA: hypothetical protein DCP08_01285 [Chloroflexi bacterium]|nr:hypothetical protein [Chloroflexota bacterium]